MTNKIKNLNLGCGRAIKKGFINLDTVRLEGVDVVHNLDKFPYPFEDNRFSYIFIDNVLEHLSNLIKTMEELNRISEDRGIIEIIVPYFSSIKAFKDPTHRQFFTLKTFDYFTENHPYNFYTPSRFEVVERRLIFPDIFNFLAFIFNKMQNIYERNWALPYLFPATGIYIKLRVIK